MSIFKSKKKKNHLPVCSDQCENCLYICEGDFICDVVNELVISDFIPIYDYCIAKEQKHDKN